MTKKKYTHFNQFERDRLEAMLSGGHKQKEIARVLQRDIGTISREIKRNRRKKQKNKILRNGPYESAMAERKARLRRGYAKYQGKKIEDNPNLKKYVIRCLKKHWSPDDIAGRMKKRKLRERISKDAIYAWIYSSWGQRWGKYLYAQRYRPKKQKKNKTKKTLIPNRTGIENRPMIVNARKIAGHYEGDTIVSGRKHHSKTSLAVVYERKLKYFDFRKIRSLKPKQFNQAVIAMRKELKIESLTLDNGIENQHHEKLGVKTYFCDPYSAWQKGGVENMIKMVRRFIPKGSDIKNYSSQYLKRVAHILNNKPRKSLGYKTPCEMMAKHNLFIKNKKPRAQKIALGGRI